MTLGHVLAVAVEVSALAAAASLGPPKLEQVLSYFRRHRGREYAAVRGAH